MAALNNAGLGKFSNGVRKIAILGSTGSIGLSTLDVVSRLKEKFEIVGLSADSNIKLLSEQARVFRPKIVSIGNELAAKEMKRRLKGDIKITFGLDGSREIVSRSDVELVVFATSGNSCIIPLIEAIRHKKQIALANKESLVSAGSIIMELARAKGVKIIPIDSEHSAIFQCLDASTSLGMVRGMVSSSNHNPQARRRIVGSLGHLSRIYLTGSGGPLFKVNAAKFDSLTLKQILNHPKWKMGRKISVDSATMMNKGFEIIEAKHFFGIDESHIEVLIHPEAVIHSMVEFEDGSVLAQASITDMRIPIQYALTYPERYDSLSRRLDFVKVGSLTFYRPEVKKFPCLGLAREAERRGGTMPAVLSASDEAAVDKFLNGVIRFSDIPKVIEEVLSRHKNVIRNKLTINDILDSQRWSKEETEALCYR